MPSPTFGYQPYSGSTSKSKSSAPSFGYAPIKTESSSGLTARQLAIIAQANSRNHHFSLGKALKNIGKEALNPVLWTFDKLMRPSYAVANAVDKGFQGEDNGFHVGAALSGAYKGFTGKEKQGFGQVFEHYGILKGHRRLRGLAGFGADVVTDPLLLLSAVAAPETGGASLAAYAALKRGAMEVTEKAAGKAAFAAGREVLEGKASQLTADILHSAGSAFKQRAALADHLNKVAEFETHGVKPLAGGLDEAKLNILRAAASAEEKAKTRYLPQLRVGTPKHNVPLTPVYIDGKRIVPYLPKMTRIVARNIPGVSRLVDATGEKLVPGFKREELHGMEIARLHVAEHNMLVHRDNIEKILGNVGSKLTEEEKLGALHLMEQPMKRGAAKWKSVLKEKGTGRYVINDRYLAKLKSEGWIDDTQEEFIRRYFNATEYLHNRDLAHGLRYKHLGDEGRMYVPHVRRSDGTPLEPSQAQYNLFTEAGFQKGRRGKMSVSQIHELVKQGKLPRDIVTDPEQLLAHTARSRAEKQADFALIGSVQDSLGIPMRVVDKAKVKRAADRIAAAEAQHTAALRQAAMAEHTLQGKLELFTEELNQEYEALAARLQKAYNKTKYGPKSRTKAARLAQIANKMKRAEMAHHDALLSLKNGKHPKLSLEEEKLAIITAEKARVEASLNLKQAIRSWNKAQKGRKNPKYSATLHREVPKALDEFGNGFAFEPEVAASLTRLRKVVSGEEKTIDDFRKGYAKWMSKWKILVTTVNPGYRFRNTGTDFWNMYVAGVPVHQIPIYGGKAAKVMRQAKTGDYVALHTIYEASAQGIMSGLFAGDVQAVAEALKYAGSKKSLIARKKPIQLMTKIAQDVNRNAENWGRLTHYLYLREARRMSVNDAALRVKAAHFDYEDLTPFEQRVLKKVFPFYTWTRKNIPFQIKAIIQHPGRYATFPKMANESEYSAGGSEGEIPDYLANQFAFKIPFGDNKYFTPQFGVSDLSALQSPGAPIDRIKQMITPAAKVPIELLLNKSFLTGQEIAGDHPRNPVSPLGAALLSAIPGSDVGTTSRGGISGPGANPYYAYMLGQLPALRTAGIATGGIKGKQTDNSALLSWLAGVSTTKVDPTEQAQFTRLELEKQADKALKGLRDSGDLPPTSARKKSENDKLLDKIIKGGG